MNDPAGRGTLYLIPSPIGSRDYSGEAGPARGAQPTPGERSAPGAQATTGERSAPGAQAAPMEVSAIVAELPALALDLLRRLDRFVVESERSALRLLSRVRDPGTMAAVSLSRLDENTRDAELAALLDPLLAGSDVGLLTEAGTPCIADPGAALVAEAHRRGIRIRPVSGPSAIILALSASGLDAQRFSFLGYLPAEREARRRFLAGMDAELGRDRVTRIFIETPYRNDRLLEDCTGILGPDRMLCVASGLSGPGERVACLGIAEWRSAAAPPAPGKVPAIFIAGFRATPRPADSACPESGRPPRPGTRTEPRTGTRTGTRTEPRTGTRPGTGARSPGKGGFRKPGKRAGP